MSARIPRFLILLVSLLLLPASNGFADDWPMLGRTPARNPVVPHGDAPVDWDIEKGTNIKWTAELGSATYGTPVIAGGHVYVGTNNRVGYIERFPKNVDLGCLICFRESDGEFLWQFSAEKHPQGRVYDWPYQGIGCPPLVQKERMWFISNRWEVVCLDTQGFRDGQNDGPYEEEPVKSPREADIIWKLDLINELGVSPHAAGMGPDRRCSIAAWKDWIYVITGNGVDTTHINLPSPNAPSLVCLDKGTGEVQWTDKSPGSNILHTQIASPLVAEIGGRVQVIAPQGDGWIRSFDGRTGELIWKFDINPKLSKWILGGSGTRNNILATPVLYENRIYIASGHGMEHGEGPGRLVCIDPTKTGDISSELAVDKNGDAVPQRRLQAVDSDKGEKAIPNPNSGLIWEFPAGGEDPEDFEANMYRTVSSVAVHDGLVIAADATGIIHCLDAETGKQHWAYDTLSPVWAPPLVVDDTVYIADEDGDVSIFRLSADPHQAMRKEKKIAEKGLAYAAGEHLNLVPLRQTNMEDTIKAGPVYANGTLYLTTLGRLYAVAHKERARAKEAKEKAKKPGKRNPQNRVPKSAFVPTPQDVVEKMLELANVKEDETVCDLGSGDGRIPIAAAEEYGAEGIGYELEANLVTTSRQKAEAAKVSDRVTFHKADLFEADLSDVDVITLYLYPAQNRALLPRLKKLKAGVRIVTHRYDLPGVTADKTLTINSKESSEEHMLYLYTTPLSVRDSADD